MKRKHGTASILRRDEGQLMSKQWCKMIEREKERWSFCASMEVVEGKLKLKWKVEKYHAYHANHANLRPKLHA